ncbi:hypothetical protein IFM89_022430 [Coptis chinensis]|uniref:BAHD acyltransferase n=1 Tax=Coptis chinensis TaxID=261450 RepID=A0A835M4J0_9MAGN|nr:hypothetical protein IFM89_022430 [Coptis chinensis]
MDVVVISREIIKPSSPTPAHLRSYKLGLLDQYQPPIYVRILLFYSANGVVDRHKNAKTTNLLKKSLSETLTVFYPVGGRFNDDQSIDCINDGVEYLEARVTGRIEVVLACPKAEDLNQLLPPYVRPLGFDGISSIQVNIFDCGGMAIGMSVPHIIADASSLSTFLNHWAAIARGANEKVSPKRLGFASLFPPRDVPWVVKYDAYKEGNPTIPRFVSKRFVFDALKISALKAKYSEKSYVECPTRVEAVGALVLRCMMKAASGLTKSKIINTIINFRRRTNPPQPQNSFGNLVFGIILPPWTTGSEPELHCLVRQLQEKIRKIDSDYTKQQLADKGLLLCHYLNQVSEMYSEKYTNVYTFSSWCRFPFYKADFGWGQPIWASPVNLTMKNSLTLMDTKNGDGIEAWVTLDEEDMARLECEQELLAFACANAIVYE